MRRLKAFLNPNTKQYWEKKYGKFIEEKQIRSDGNHLLKFMHFFQKAESILDFGSGLGGNVQYLSGQLKKTRFILIDQSETSLDFARSKLLGEADDKGNTFEYLLNLNEVPDHSIELVMSIEVLEHITEYRDMLDRLWGKLKPGGILLISVPVLGIRDRTRVHVNKFTVKSMLLILSLYSEIIHVSPRTFSKRSGRLSTAYFYVEKSE
jgi:2-polyprenyl-3-methyl-5-hydroxy-6-metoxy-1,4-benzoquinol methylase